MIDPNMDGVTHINIYTKGKTEVGRELTNLAYSPFTYQGYGTFKSVEGFWYYYLTGCKYEHFKNLNGYKAKQEGKRYRDDRIDKSGLTDKDKEVLLEAIRCKLRQNKDILRLLVDSELPFEHYYWYGNEGSYKVYELPQYQWIVDEITRIRKVMKDHVLTK